MSSSPSPAMRFAQLVATTDDDTVRRELLARSKDAFSPDLVEALATLASQESRRDPANAERAARVGAEIATEINDIAGQASCLRAAGGACIRGGRYQDALQFLTHAADLARTIGDDEAVLRCEGFALHAMLQLEHYDEALELGERTLQAFVARGNESGEIQVRMALADLHFRMDQPRKALQQYSNVDRALTDETSDRVRGALASNRANSLEACNRFRAAMRQFAKARELFASQDCTHTVALVDYNTAYAEFCRGRYQDALQRYATTEEAFTELGDQRHLAHIDLDRAEIHLSLNMPADARKLAIKARDRFVSLRLKKEEAQARLLVGRAAALQSEPAVADEAFAAAQQIFSELGLTERVFRCVVQRASVAEHQCFFDAAQQLADEAVELLGAGMNPISGASVDLLRGRIALATDRATDALVLAAGVLDTCRRIHAPWVHVEAHRIQGRALAARGHLEDAAVSYERAIDFLEAYRGGVPPDEFMAAFLAGRAQLYGDVVDTLVKLGHPSRAFEFAERAKSRALVDLLAGRQDAGDEAERSTSRQQRIRYLRERLHAVYGQVFRAADEPEERSARSLRMAQKEATKLEDEIAVLMRDRWLDDPRGASLESVETGRLEETRQSLDPGQVLIEYFLIDGTLFTFALTRESTQVVSQPMTEAELRSRMERFHFHLSKYQRPHAPPEEVMLPALRANLQALTDILIAPLREWLDGVRLVIVPHGVLHHLPFHALPWGDGWLCDRYEIVYAPSAAVYRHCQKDRARATGTPCVFGLPDDDAPQIEDEARQVAARLGTTRLYLREEATFECLEREIRDAPLVHIATHGMFRQEQPMLSSIRLADRWINLYDLYELRISADLVVLSTCESGTAGVTGGDEILGLTRGLLYAGAPALITSQWRVNDAATTAFMDAFYRHLNQNGDAATAHRSAMAQIREDHPHPFFWAPFFLTGRPIDRPAAETSEKNDARLREDDREAVTTCTRMESV